MYLPNYESLVTSEGIYLMPLNQLKIIDKTMENSMIEKNNFTGIVYFIVFFFTSIKIFFSRG